MLHRDAMQLNAYFPSDVIFYTRYILVVLK